MNDPPDYLVGLSDEDAERLAAVNRPGLAALRRYLDAGNAIAFLGAGVSVPLYPLWDGVVRELIDATTDRGLDPTVATTLRELASEQPDAVVEQLRRHLGVPQYQAALRQTFRVRRDATTAQTWTPTHELVCRMPLAGVVTTNYDPGIVDARIRVRPRASSTGFASWTDELRLDDWLTGDVFGIGEELPVLFAHGHHNQPDAMVLATTEYRRAYAGKLAQVLGRLIESQHLVWIGFSFADARIAAILREVAETAGTRIDPGRAARHIAVMPWDPAGTRDPTTLRTLAEIQYGADLILYPAANHDHSALRAVLADFADPRFPVPEIRVAQPAAATKTPPAPGQPDLPVTWVPEVEVVSAFVGRVEELGRLDRWAADPSVRLIGVSAWGGAGKTTLVAEWLGRGGGELRPGARGVFGWSFYADPSVTHWIEGLLRWVRETLGVQVAARPGGRVRAVDVVSALLTAGVLVVLDGLEVVQEGPAGDGFGRLLDGELREVLNGACRTEHPGLVVLTSRFPFADLEVFDGGAARMLELPPLTPAEGASVLAESGADWVAEDVRRDLVAAVDGHALAVSALGGVLADRIGVDVMALHEELLAAGRTDARVAKVLQFYADRLAEPDRWLVAAVGLFAHPVSPEALLSVAAHDVFAGRLAGWTPGMVRQAVLSRLSGLLSWHPDGTVSAHPLVRDAFRPLAMGAAQLAADAALGEVPERIASREDGLRVVEAVELLLDAGEWLAADQLYTARTSNGELWIRLPAVRLGLRAGSAFVGSRERRAACPTQLSPGHLRFYLTSVGLCATLIGDLAAAEECLQASADQVRAAEDQSSLAISLTNLVGCHAQAGRLADAQAVAQAVLSLAGQMQDRRREQIARAYLAWVMDMSGDASEAERQFLTADRIAYADDPDGDHLYSLAGVQYGEFLAVTGRVEMARLLTDRNRQISIDYGWNENVARCDRLLAVLDLAGGDHAAALDRCTSAVRVFRDGEYLTELALALTVLAEAARAGGDLPSAHRTATEALDVAAPRDLRPAHAAALTVRALVRADQAATTADAGLRDTLIRRGRDDAEAALRLTRRHGLARHELAALDAHARLDQVEQRDHEWAAAAAALGVRLAPADPDPDPLATVERLVAEEREAAGDEADAEP